MVVTIYIHNNALGSSLTALQAAITHIATGDDDTTPTEGDTSLGNETYIEPLFDEEVTSTKYIASMFQDTTENNGNDIKEVGLFDSAVAGNMYFRNLTNLIPKTVTIEAFIEAQTFIDVENI